MTGANGAHRTMLFSTLGVDRNGLLALPAANSAIYLARTVGPKLSLTLPAPAQAVGRFVSVRRVDDGGRVLISSGAAPLEGGRELRARDGNSDVIALDERWDWVTFVTDGTSWFVFESGH